MSPFILVHSDDTDETFVHTSRESEPIGRIEQFATEEDDPYEATGVFDAWTAKNAERDRYCYCGRYTNIIAAARDIVTAYHSFTANAS